MLALVHCTVRYGGVAALDDVTLRIAPGERVAVCGPNGAGKSTLLGALLDAALAAAPPARGAPPPAVFVPQEPPAELDLSLSAHDYVMLGRTPYLSAWRRPAAADERAVRAALDAVGLAGDARRRLGALSGGARRRLALALALASEAPALLLDEATAHFDPSAGAAACARLAATGRTVVMAIHARPLPAPFFTRVVEMAQGRIREDTRLSQPFHSRRSA